jgi:hypothetical protein
LRLEAVTSRIQGTGVTDYANLLGTADLKYIGRDSAKQIGFSNHNNKSSRSRESEEFLDQLSDC